VREWKKKKMDSSKRRKLMIEHHKICALRIHRSVSHAIIPET